MKKTKKNTLIALLLCATMVFSLSIGVLPISASAVTQDEIDALKEKKQTITDKKKEQQAIVDALEEQKASVLERKKALDDRNTYTLEQMQLNNEEIELYSQMIEEKSKEVDAAKALEDEQLERYRSRVRTMEENGSYSFLSVLLQADSLSDLLTAIDDIGEIMESDKKLEDAYIEARLHTEQVKAEYEQYKTELEAKQEELRQEQEELQRQLDETDQLIRNIVEDLSGENSELEALINSEKAASEEINKLIEELEEQRRQEEAANRPANNGGSGGNAVSNGNFGWPVPSCTYITSRCGTRVHPISGETKYHSGLDIGASYGATVVAAAGGTVSMATVNGGYGNCVMIDHGNGYYTLYGHLSSFAVSAGDTVTRGQTIAYVGSTGYSTGPHLHYEIRYGSTIYDPEPFYPDINFTYAADAGE